MAKRRKVLTFCLWLNRAGKDVILGRSNLFIFEIVKPGTSSRTGAGELAEQNGR